MDSTAKKLQSLTHWVHQIRSLDTMSPKLAVEIASMMYKDMERIDAEAEVADGEERLAFQYRNYRGD